MRITEDQLRRIAPRCEDFAKWIKPLNDTLRQFKFEDPGETAAFLAQIVVESASLNRVEENLRYSAQRIMEVWPKKFATIADAQLCASNPTRLACTVYDGRNGNRLAGDGYAYRGRGLLQITGRANYEAIGKEIGADLVNFPDALLEPKFAALSAGAYWKLRVRPGKKFDPESVTKAVTGSAMLGSERKKVYEKALEVLGVGKRTDDHQSREAGVAREAHGQEAATSSASWL